MKETLRIWLNSEAAPRLFYEPDTPGGTKMSWISPGNVTLAVVTNHVPRKVEVFPLVNIVMWEHAT